MTPPLVDQNYLTDAPYQAVVRSALAYHEAGHAVMALFLKYQVLWVTLVSTGETEGNVRWIAKPHPGADLRADELLITAAGRLADEKAHGFEQRP